MNTSFEQVFVGLIAMIGIFLVVLAIVGLVKILLKFAEFAASTAIDILICIIIDVLIDVRIILLVSCSLTMFSYYSNGEWRLISSALSLECFCLSALYVFTFLSNKKDDKIAKNIHDAIRAGAGFWGLVGSIISFALCTFCMSNIWELMIFQNLSDGKISFNNSLKYSLQIVLDTLPINLKKWFGFTISDITICNDQYFFVAFAFIYQIILILSLTQVIVFFWRIKKRSVQDQ